MLSCRFVVVVVVFFVLMTARLVSHSIINFQFNVIHKSVLVRPSLCGQLAEHHSNRSLIASRRYFRHVQEKWI